MSWTAQRFVLDVVDPVFLAITSRGRSARNKEISCQINSQEKICVANKGGDAHVSFLASDRLRTRKRKRGERRRKADVDRELNTRDNPCENAISSCKVAIFNSRRIMRVTLFHASHVILYFFHEAYIRLKHIPCCDVQIWVFKKNICQSFPRDPGTLTLSSSIALYRETNFAPLSSRSKMAERILCRGNLLPTGARLGLPRVCRNPSR